MQILDHWNVRGSLCELFFHVMDAGKFNILLSYIKIDV